jgi:hypothetical protein
VEAAARRGSARTPSINARALGVESKNMLCPVWVISGNGVTPASCPFFPSKQTFVSASGTSAMCQDRTWPPLQEVAELPLVMTADPPHHCLAGNLARSHEPIVASSCRNSLGVGAIKRSAVQRYNLCAGIWDRPARLSGLHFLISADRYQVPPAPKQRATTAHTTICLIRRIAPIRLKPVIALPRYLTEEPIDQSGARTKRG